MTSRWLFLLIPAALVGGWLVGHHASSPSAPGAPDPVASDSAAAEPATVITTAKARSGHLERTLVLYGTAVTPAESMVDISASSDVRIRRVLVSMGAQVESGAALFEVEPSDDARQQLAEAQRQVIAADADLALARQRQELQLGTATELAVAEHAATAATAHRDVLTQRQSPSAMMLTAPTAGTVVALIGHPGQLATMGTALASVAPAGTLSVRFGIAGVEAARLTVGQPMTCAAFDALDQPWSAAIRTIGNEVDAQSHLVTITAAVPAGLVLRTGDLIRGAIVLPTVDGVIVPRVALRVNDGESSVFTIVADKAAQHVVRVLGEDETAAVISGDGVQADTVVAISAVRMLADGVAVAVADDHATAEHDAEPAAKKSETLP